MAVPGFYPGYFATYPMPMPMYPGLQPQPSLALRINSTVATRNAPPLYHLPASRARLEAVKSVASNAHITTKDLNHTFADVCLQLPRKPVHYYSSYCKSVAIDATENEGLLHRSASRS